ncbi:MAG: metallophosphoesterase [Bacteroidales bacterium]|nr:metallophosphoesterase [Bacteroidales bacterium]
MKRFLQWALFISVSLLLVWALKHTFPKNTGALNYFLLFLFLDAFLWVMTWREIRFLRPFWKYLLATLFWIPFGLVLAGVVAGFFSTYFFWPQFVKTYLTSIVFTAYASKAIPVIVLFAILLCQGLLLLLSKVSPRFKPVQRRPGKLFLTGWLGGILLFLLMMAGMVLWEHHVKVRKTEITLKELPHAFNGFRIVQISDLHLGSWNRKSKLVELVDKINELKPDLLFFTGDLCNYSTMEAWPFQQILGKIKATYGIYAVLGNHDYGDYMTWISNESKRQNMLDLYRFYDELGWKLLRNEHDFIVLHHDSLAIIGVENWGVLNRFQRLADLPKAMAGTENVPTKLLLSHDPSHWDSIVSREYPGIDITFAGHTHGGQVGIETNQFHWSLIQYTYPEWAGLYQKKWHDSTTQYLYVNRGAGTIGYTGRVGIWAEITLIILMGSESEKSMD